MGIKSWLKRLVSSDEQTVVTGPVTPAVSMPADPVVVEVATEPSPVSATPKKRTAKKRVPKPTKPVDQVTAADVAKKLQQEKTDPTIDSVFPAITIYPPMPKVKPTRKSRKPKESTAPIAEPVDPTAAEKAAATAAGEPWVAGTGIDLDVDNLSSGSFNLDWNEIFVAKLIRAGYKGKSDIDLVDQWFSDICRNVLAENFEQMIADPTNRTAR